jgi:hypothetical protein
MASLGWSQSLHEVFEAKENAAAENPCEELERYLNAPQDDT